MSLNQIISVLRREADVGSYFMCKERGAELCVRRLSDLKGMLAASRYIHVTDAVFKVLKMRTHKWHTRLLRQSTLRPDAPAWDPMGRLSLVRQIAIH
jgi:hypothetical protein